MGLLCAGFCLCPHGNQGTERSEDSLRIHGKSCVRDVTLEDGVGVMLCKGSPGEMGVWSTSPLKSSSALRFSGCLARGWVLPPRESWGRGWLSEAGSRSGRNGLILIVWDDANEKGH